MKYRKKPVVIEAVRFAFPMSGRDLAKWCGGTFEPESGYILIDTLEGTMTAHPGDWIIQGVKGEFYPCKPDIFDATYEAEDYG
jgi:hypothetical protein